MFLVSQEVPSADIICLFKLSELHLSQKWGTKDISIKLSPCLSQSQTKIYPGRGNRIFFHLPSTPNVSCWEKYIACGRISEWNNLKWVSANKEKEGIVSHRSHSFTVHSREGLKSSFNQADLTLLLQEASSRCVCNTRTSTCPNQPPFEHVTDAAHIVAELLCTGIPMPGLRGP